MKAGPLLLFGTAALGFFFPGVACAQGTSPPPKDQTAPVEAFEAEEISLPKEGLVRLEVFTLSLEEGRAATRRFPKQADLYAWLGAELEQEKPKVTLERLMVLRVRGGQKSKLEEIDEYPVHDVTEPPRIPKTTGQGRPTPAAADAEAAAPTRPPAAPPPPVFFNYRNTGWTTEIEMTISSDEETVDINMSPEFVRLCGVESQSPGVEVVLPVFETSKIATMIVTKFGQPTLAGTFSPPVDAGVEGGNTEPITRLLFLTVTNPR
jgi:hypothetical protein